MANNPACEPCCNPVTTANSLLLYRTGVIKLLCDVVSNTSGSPVLPVVGDLTYGHITLANNTNTALLAANADRKKGTFIQNTTSGSTIWIKEGAAAVVGEGAAITYLGVYLTLTTGAVNGIQSSGGNAIANTAELA